MSETVTIVRTANLDLNCYPSGPGGPDVLFQMMVDRMQGIFTSLGFSGLIISATAPGVDDRGKAWLDTNDGNIYRWWTLIGFTGWARKHPVDPGSGRGIWWRKAEADLVTEDGGDANPIGIASGPFWVRDTDWDGTVPVAKGTVPGTSPPVVLAEGNTGGAWQESITIQPANFPPHAHPVGLSASPNSYIQTGTNKYSFNVSDGHNLGCQNAVNGLQGLTELAGGAPDGSTTPMTISHVPPYRVGFWAKRTIREYILPP